MKMKRFFALSCALALMTVAHAAQPISGDDIDRLVARTMEAYQVPGMAVAVVKDGRVIHEKGYGVRHLEKGGEVTPLTNFNIASNSKAFCAVTLALLVDEGKINWDDKVVDYIPEFRLYDPWVTREFTIRDLLTHRSGLALGAGDLSIFPDGGDFTIDDVIRNLRWFRPETSFRSSYAYNNQMYMVAGEVVARVSGMSWQEFVERRVFAPLGMTASAGDNSRLTDKNNFVGAHAVIDGRMQVIDTYRMPLVSSAGSIVSNVRDLTKWVMMHLAGGKYGTDGKEVFLSQKTHKELLTPQTIMSGGPVGFYKEESATSHRTHFNMYGLGFRLSDVRGWYVVGHTGSVPGSATRITMLPEMGLGIIVLTNQYSSSVHTAVANSIIDAWVGIKGADRVAEVKSIDTRRQQEARKVVDAAWAKAAAEQTRLAGDRSFEERIKGAYDDPWFGRITIEREGERLRLTSARSPKMCGDMYPYDGLIMLVKWDDREIDADSFVKFETDFQGRITGIVMKAISPLTDFSYDVHDLNFTRVAGK